MTLDPDLVRFGFLLLGGERVTEERAGELARLLDDRDEFLAHLLVTEGLLDRHPDLAAALREAARASYLPPSDAPAPPPAAGAPSRNPAAFMDLHRAQRAVIEAEVRNYDLIGAAAAAENRFRGRDAAFPYVADPHSVPPRPANRMPARSGLGRALAVIASRLRRGS